MSDFSIQTHLLTFTIEDVWLLYSDPSSYFHYRVCLTFLFRPILLSQYYRVCLTSIQTHLTFTIEYVWLLYSDPSYFHYRVCLSSLFRPILLSLHYRACLTFLLRPILLSLYYLACLTSLFRPVFFRSLQSMSWLLYSVSSSSFHYRVCLTSLFRPIFLLSLQSMSDFSIQTHLLTFAIDYLCMLGILPQICSLIFIYR